MNSRISHLALASAAFCGAAFAQNDDCSGAITLALDTPVNFDTTAATAGTAFTCGGGGGPDLWYSYTPSGSGIDVEIQLCGSSYDTAVEVLEGDCAALSVLACNDDSCGLQSAITISNAPAGAALLIRVGGFAGATGAGVILVSENSNPGCGAPDMFEDSDDCATAFAIVDGMYPDLNVEEADNDFYGIVLADGATLDASIFFDNDDGDCDLYLWDPAVACDTNVVGTGTGTGALAVGFTASDDEIIAYTNTTGAAQSLILEVDMFTAAACNNYDLVISGSGGGPGMIGTSYCMAAPNSTGSVGMMSATGSQTATDNNVTLTASALPTDVHGYFITSTTQGFTSGAGGGEGNICLGGTIGRYLAPGQMQSSGAAGSISLAIDLSATPLSMGFGTVMAGDTWNYQLWHRDMTAFGGTTSNFTDGLSILFN